ncbi:MAG: NADAR family protein [Bacteroidota bacterium]
MAQLPATLDQIQQAVQRSRRFKYLFFWGHKPRSYGQVDRACLSQWYTAPFSVDGHRYPTAEHFMMAEKARLFGDEDMRQRIITATHPGAAKKLGRQVRGFKDATWQRARFDIVVLGNRAKFEQNEALGEFLRRTNRRVLVEASPRDRIWGIGLTADDPRAANPLSWRGANLLGFALMEARSALLGD